MPKLLGFPYSNNKFDGLFSYFRNNSLKIPSHKTIKIRSSQSEENREYSSLFDNNFSSFWASYGATDYPYIEFDFMSKYFSLTGYTLYGIYNPYVVSYNISGSNNRVNWELIDEQYDLGERIHAKAEYFNSNYHNDIAYRYIKITSLKSKLTNNEDTYSLISFFEIEFFGTLIEKIPKITCFYRQKKNSFFGIIIMMINS